MTFQDYAIDIEKGAFADGQAYVPLSHAKSLESIKLIRPLGISGVKVSPVVQQFYLELDVND